MQTDNKKPCAGAADVKKGYDRGGLVGSYNPFKKDHVGGSLFLPFSKMH